MADILKQSAISARLDDGELRMARMERDIADIKRSLSENTELTQKVKELVETWSTVSRVTSAIGTAARWLAGVGAAVVAGWQLAKNWKGG